MPSQPDRANLLVGLGLAALGVLMAITALDIEVQASAVLLGPRLFPLTAAGGLVLLGLATALVALRAPSEAPQADAGAEHTWGSFAFVLAGLVMFGLIAEPLGFVPAATTLFACVARAFDSRRPVRDLLVGLVLAILIYVLFVHGLGLSLSPGEWLRALLSRGG